MPATKYKNPTDPKYKDMIEEEIKENVPMGLG
jgi:hypothetical protein